MLNRTEIIGRVGADAEVKDFPTSQLISFSVAVSESYTNKQGEKVTNTTWVECSRWTNNVSIAQYIKKGDLIYVEGKMNNRAYLGSDGEAKVVNGINSLDLSSLPPGIYTCTIHNESRVFKSIKVIFNPVKISFLVLNLIYNAKYNIYTII